MKRHSKLRGLYLVIEPILPIEQLLIATEKALDGGVDLLQFSAGKKTGDLHFLGGRLSGLAKRHGIPFFVNNSLELAKEVKADGVHLNTFDVPPNLVRGILGKEAIVGYTVNRDLEKIKWAEQEGADYVSFCSIFQQRSSNKCSAVPLETLRKVAQASKLAVFAAGGINLENVLLVLDTGVDGVAVTSAILKSEDPQQTATEFKQVIGKYGKKKII